MQLKRLSVTNWRCFEDETVSFEPGVIVLYGVNGAGKSTLLEAAFFALYGSDALETGTTMEDVITIGGDEAEVDLVFNHQGEDYRIQRRIVNTPSQTTHNATLQTPDKTYGSVTEVDNLVASRLLNLDAEAFLNSAYVKQGDITRLIEASPSERQEIVDNLLQLGRLETYESRMDAVRLGVNNAHDTVQMRIAGLEEQLAELPDKETIDTEIADLEGQAKRVTNHVDQVQRQEDLWEQSKTEAVERKQELEDLQAEINDAENKVTETRKRIQEASRSHRQARRHQAKLDHKIKETGQRIETLAGVVAQDRDQRDLTIGECSHIPVSETQPSLYGDTAEVVDISIDTLAVPTVEFPTDRSAITTADVTEAKDNIKQEFPGSNDLQNAVSALSQADNKISDLKSELETLEQDIEDQTNEIERLSGDDSWDNPLVEDAESESIPYLEAKIGRLQDSIEQRRSELEDSRFPFDPNAPQEPLESIAEDLTAEAQSLDEEITSVSAEIQRYEGKITEAENLQAEGRCPECGQTVEGSPHINNLDEWREAVADKRKHYERLSRAQEFIEDRAERAEEWATEGLFYRSNRDSLKQYEQELAEARDRVSELEMSVADTQTQIEEKQLALEDARETRADAAKHLETTYREVVRLQAIEHMLEKLEDTVDDRTTYEQRRTGLNVDRERKLANRASDDYKTALKRLQEAITSFDSEALQEAEQHREQAERRLTQLNRVKQMYGEIDSSIAEQRISLENEREQVTGLKKRQAKLSERTDRLNTLLEECSNLTSMFSEIRADLRQQNVDRLEYLLNELFQTIYRNDAYSTIEMDGEYKASFVEKGGNDLPPDMLSGGESAVFNLALRGAIYQLLVEGFEDSVPMPPLILDEPTAHLDSGHVGRIEAIVDAMREAGVDQTIVVSHDESLIDTADHSIELEIIPGSNRSQVAIDEEISIDRLV